MARDTMVGMRKGRKIIARVIVFLLLIVGGAIVNVAVAWGCAMPHRDRAFFEPTSPLLWPEGAPASWQRTPTHFGELRWFGLTRSTWAALPDNINGEWCGLLRETTGLPARSLQCSEVADEVGAVRFDSFHVNWGSLSGKRFPLRPLWPGFAINTLFYAGILWGGWLMFAAPFALRRRRRIKRGLCPACAYPVGDSEVCTECGKALTRAVRT